MLPPPEKKKNKIRKFDLHGKRNYMVYLLVVTLFWFLLQMIKSKVGNIKSGWRSVFMIFTAAADDDSESIVDSAFENVEQGKTFSSS